MTKPLICLLAGAATLTSGCMSHGVRKEIDRNETDARQKVEVLAARNTSSRVTEVSSLIVPVAKIPKTQTDGAAWLRAKRLNLDLKEPVPLATILQMLADRGVNLVVSVPQLENYSFAGTVTQGDAETVLRVVLGSVGLDYETDDTRQLVTVRPMASKTWVINLGNRQTSYTSGSGVGQGRNAGSQSSNSNMGGGNGSLNNMGSGGNQNGSGFGASTGAGNGSTFGGNGGNGGNQGSALANNTGMNGTGIQTRDDFWGSLAVELQNRLSILAADQGGGQLSQQPMQMPAVPGGYTPIQPPSMPGNSNGQNARKQIGTFALNPETGAITVQAPHWVLSDLDKYFAQVQRMYNADISFQGEVLLVTHTRTDSEGLDVSSFGKFASGRYGAIVSNNALGGVTVNFADGNIPNVVAGAQPVAGALMGVASAADGLQVFNAWLSEVGRVSVMQRPVMTTTSSVPAEFRREFNRCFNTISQEVASGGVGNAALGTTNTLQCKDFGIALTINPRYDLSANLVRAQISLNHILPAGEQIIQQTISSGDNVRAVPTRIPLETRASYSGEALLRDGDLIVIGGQTEDSSSLDENGLPGQQGTLSGIFGSKRANRETKTYYFALRVSVKPRGAQQ